MWGWVRAWGCVGEGVWVGACVRALRIEQLTFCPYEVPDAQPFKRAGQGLYNLQLSTQYALLVCSRGVLTKAQFQISYA